MSTEKKYILGLDVSTKTIGIALYEDLGDKGALIVLTHVTPKIKPVPKNKNEELQFTDNMAKMISTISLFCRLLIPLITDFLAQHNLKDDKLTLDLVIAF